MPRALARLALALSALVLSAAASAPSILSGPRGSTEVHRLIGILDYLAADYPPTVSAGRVINEAEYREQVHLSGEARRLAARLPPAQGAAPRTIEAAVEEVERRIGARAEGSEVRRAVQLARRKILGAYDVRLSPLSPPSIARGRALYEKACVPCHGARGAGDGPQGLTLKPPPRNLRAPEFETALSPYHVYNVVTFGVDGTAMASFDSLSSNERWAVAWYVLALRHDDGQTRARADGSTPPRVPGLSLAELAALTDAQLRERLSAWGVGATQVDRALSLVRSRPPRTAAESPMSRTRRLLQQGLDAYRAGDRERARGLLVDSYIEGFEPLEPRLRAAAPRLLGRLEAEFLDVRVRAGRGRPADEVDRQGQRILVLLDRADSTLARGTNRAAVAFLGALTIIVREGIEAALVVAALLALLGRVGRKDAVRKVHAGWIAALVAGGVTFVVAARLVALGGAERELVEAIVGLLAAAMLAWASYFLVAQAHARKWIQSIKAKTEKEIASGGRGLAVAGIAFLAVYREAFESVLFFQALWLGLPAGASAMPLWLGALGGAALLVLVIFLIFRLTSRLPLGAFFSATGWLLYALAAVLAGKAVRSLVEAGVLAPHPLAVPAIPWLGIHPDAVGLAVQGAFVAAAAAGLLLVRRRRSAATI